MKTATRCPCKAPASTAKQQAPPLPYGDTEDVLDNLVNAGHELMEAVTRLAVISAQDLPALKRWWLARVGDVADIQEAIDQLHHTLESAQDAASWDDIPGGAGDKDEEAIVEAELVDLELCDE